METTRNNLPENTKKFFNRLSEYLDNKLYYYGSIQRSDYIPGKSDVDVVIFTDNEYSTMAKMQHFLHVKKTDFKKVVWVVNETTTYGYKLKYTDLEENILAEFSIYNERFKDTIINEHILKFDLPIYISILLYILKYFYYQIPFLSSNTYATYKRFILNRGFGQENVKFLVINPE
jgi:hypothetical protein